MEESKAIVESTKSDLENSKTDGIFPLFSVDQIDTSWMTKPQKTFFEVLKNPANRDKRFDELIVLAGYKTRQSWYYAIKDERFTNLLESMGVQVRIRSDKFPLHHEVEYIKSPKEREDYLNGDVWDVRRLFDKFPRHRDPSNFIIDFTKVKNPILKVPIKRYYINMLANWQPRTIVSNFGRINAFFNILHDNFPEIRSLREIDRQTHIEKILLQIHSIPTTQAIRVITNVRAMFKYMYDNKWDDGPKTDALLITYDTPRKDETLPTPIPPNIVVQLDEYLENTIIPLLKKGENTPIVKPEYWDFIIIMRYTGRGFEDIVHLIVDSSEKDCLRYDLDGDPQLLIDHRITKIEKDLVIPLAHLKDMNGNNCVEQAILRQKERVKDLLPVKDGEEEYKYLFREIYKYDENDNPIVEVLRYDKFNKNIVLPKVCNQIPLKNNDSSIYKITSDQFRSTVVTEMIDAGIDIYAIKEFLGHSSIRMTERYIKVYQQRLKKEFKEKLSKSDATKIKNNLPDLEQHYDNQWVKNKIIAQFNLQKHEKL
ncbi:MAG: tyrosine-type recombinase/integrase [Bacillota bacterium]